LVLAVSKLCENRLQTRTGFVESVPGGILVELEIWRNFKPAVAILGGGWSLKSFKTFLSKKSF